MIRPSWESVVDALNGICDLALRPDSLLFLLGIREDVVAGGHVKFFLAYAVFYVR